MRAGERHLVVPGSSDAAFRRALRDAGYLLAATVSVRRKAEDSTPLRPASRHVAIGPENALIVQSDCSVLLDVHAPRAAEARAALAPFAELVKSPEHVHTYRLTPLSIWNACASGLAAGQMVAALRSTPGTRFRGTWNRRFSNWRRAMGGW